MLLTANHIARCHSHRMRFCVDKYATEYEKMQEDGSWTSFNLLFHAWDVSAAVKRIHVYREKTIENQCNRIINLCRITTVCLIFHVCISCCGFYRTCIVNNSLLMLYLWIWITLNLEKKEIKHFPCIISEHKVVLDASFLQRYLTFTSRVLHLEYNFI